MGGEGRRRSRRKKRRGREEQIQGGSRGRREKISAPAIGGFNLLVLMHTAKLEPGLCTNSSRRNRCRCQG